MDTISDTESDIAIGSVVLQDGVFCLLLGGRTVPLRLGPEPVSAFVPGWRPAFVYTGFTPFILLQFSSDSGETAVWIIDANGNRLGGSVAELEAGTRESLRGAATPRIAQLMNVVLQQPTLILDSRSHAFLRLPDDFRREIGQLCAGSALAEPQRLILDDPSTGWEDAWSVSREHVEALLSIPFQNRLVLATQDGMLSWPSPVDGKKLMVQGSLCSDDFRFTYRLVDADHRLVCFPIVSDHLSITLGLYVPGLNLLVIRNNSLAGVLNVYLPRVADWLVTLTCRFGATLEGYFRFGARSVASILRGYPGTHIGHQLWNELTGIDHFLRAARGPYLPRWIVPGAETEIWGPLDEIFPQLDGSVDRSSSHSDIAIQRSYETGTCLVRVTGNYVSAELQASLGQSVKADPIYAEVKKIVTSRPRSSAPIILLGLRVENRTVVDLLDFCESFLEHVADVFPGAMVVVDGHNSGRSGGIIISHHELRASRSPLAVERQIAAHLGRLQVGRDVTVVDILGSSIRTSLAWGQHADCFFAIWGASLAKYRWACNKPGLVITSKWNLINRGDLNIYDSPAFVQAPSVMTFVDESFVKDRPDAPQLVDFGSESPSFCNFDVDSKAVFQQFSKVVDNNMSKMI